MAKQIKKKGIVSVIQNFGGIILHNQQIKQHSNGNKISVAKTYVEDGLLEIDFPYSIIFFPEENFKEFKELHISNNDEEVKPKIQPKDEIYERKKKYFRFWKEYIQLETYDDNYYETIKLRQTLYGIGQQVILDSKKDLTLTHFYNMKEKTLNIRIYSGSSDKSIYECMGFNRREITESWKIELKEEYSQYLTKIVSIEISRPADLLDTESLWREYYTWLNQKTVAILSLINKKE